MLSSSPSCGWIIPLEMAQSTCAASIPSDWGELSIFHTNRPFYICQIKGLTEWVKEDNERMSSRSRRTTFAQHQQQSNCSQIADTLLVTTIRTVSSSLLSVREVYSLQEVMDPALHNIHNPPHANAIRHNSNCHQLFRHVWQMKFLPKISSVVRFCSSLSLAAFPFRIHCIRLPLFLLLLIRRRFVRLCRRAYWNCSRHSFHVWLQIEHFAMSSNDAQAIDLDTDTFSRHKYLAKNIRYIETMSIIVRYFTQGVDSFGHQFTQSQHNYCQWYQTTRVSNYTPNRLYLSPLPANKKL